jgi:hypothetical protein
VLVHARRVREPEQALSDLQDALADQHLQRRRGPPLDAATEEVAVEQGRIVTRVVVPTAALSDERRVADRGREV